MSVESVKFNQLIVDKFVNKGWSDRTSVFDEPEEPSVKPSC